MRRLAGVLLVSAACSATSVAPPPTTERERAAYAVGLKVGMGLMRQQADVDPELVLLGMVDAMRRADPRELLIDEEAIRGELRVLVPTLREREHASLRADHDERDRRARTFLAENGKRAGVVSLPTGVQYRVLARGLETRVGRDDRITVHYEARDLEGALIDTSKDRVAPTILRLSRAPAAWREVLPQLGAGARVEIFAPAASSPSHGGLRASGLLAYTVEVLAVEASRKGAPRPDSTDS